MKQLHKMMTLAGLMLLLNMPAALAQSDDSSPADSSSNGTSDATKQLQNYLDNTKSMTAKFNSVVLDANGIAIEDLARTGTISIKRPGRFRWEYASPTPFIVVADGRDWWSYDEDMEQAVVRKLDDYRGANPTLLLGGDANITDEFEIESSWEVEGSPWMELVPKDEKSDFVKVRLTFKQETIHLMELIDRLDKTSRIIFSDVELNPEIDDDRFIFTLPEGVDLIGTPSAAVENESDETPQESAAIANEDLTE